MITEIKSTQPSNVLDVRWALSNVCNYKCDYCFPGSNEGNYRFPTNTRLLVKKFDQIFNFYRTHLGKDKIDLRLLGGEPTLWPDLEYFIRSIKERHNVYVSVITNGSRTIRWWQENNDLIDNVTLSYHKKFASLSHVIDVADILYKAGKKITVHVLMDPTVWDECVNDIDTMKRESKYPWLIQTKAVTPTSQFFPVYSKDQIKFMEKGIKRIPSLLWFAKHIKLILNKTIRLYESVYVKDGIKHKAKSETYIINGDVNFKGYECNMGIESLYINWDGTISSSCGQELFGGAYNIFDDVLTNFSPLISPVICQQHSCLCPTENHVSKKYIKIHSV